MRINKFINNVVSVMSPLPKIALTCNLFLIFKLFVLRKSCIKTCLYIEFNILSIKPVLKNQYYTLFYYVLSVSIVARNITSIDLFVIL